MNISMDTLQALFWSITYVLIIIYNVREHMSGIPPIAISMNFAWESMALAQDLIRYHHSHWIHMVWFTLDVVIIITYFVFCKPVYFKPKWLMAVLFSGGALLLVPVFRLGGGMLISSFVIDCTMAVEWFAYSFNENFRPNVLSFAFCTTKLVGDLFAWLYYRRFTPFVYYAGIGVLILNIGCLFKIITRYRRQMNAM